MSPKTERFGTETPSRLGIYFFYDPQGIVDGYVLHFLREINSSLDKLLIVCNGLLSAEGREAFEALGDVEVLVRPNVGFDVWAYKAGIDRLGWPAIYEFDELLMMNFTIMGPVGSFSPMFEEMEARDLDFWGITVHNGADFDPWGIMPEGLIPLHIQSHFIAVRNRMLRSPEFRSYWDDMVPINSYEDSIARHESLFTQRFERAGFRWGVFVDTADLVATSYYPLFNYPVELIRDRRSPIFKRKIFFSTPDVFLDENSNRAARELADFLQASPDFDFDLALDHLLRSSNQYDLSMGLNMFEVLSSSTPSRSVDGTVSTAVVIDAASLSELRVKVGYAESFPPGTEFFVHVLDPGVQQEEIVVAFAERRIFSGLNILRLPEPGRPPRTGLRIWAAELTEFDLICNLAVFDESEVFPGTIQTSANKDALEGVATTRGYVDEVIRLFGENPKLGLLSPPPPLHGTFFGRYGREWADSFAAVSAVAAERGWDIPLHAAKPPLAPTAGVFWARKDALREFLDTGSDGDVLTSRQTRLVYPLVVQAGGFYPSYVMPDFLASNIVTTLSYATKKINEIIGTGALDSLSTLEYRLRASTALADEMQAAPIATPRPAVIYVDYGSGYTEDQSVITSYKADPFVEGRLTLRVDIPRTAKYLRFDPVEGQGCIIRGFDVHDENGLSVRSRPLNGLRKDGVDLFVTHDPQYVISAWPARSETLVIELQQLVTIPWSRRRIFGVTRLADAFAARVRHLLRPLVRR